MKKVIFTITILAISSFCFALGSWDDETITDKQMQKLEQQIRKNRNVKNVEVTKQWEYAETCEANVILKNGGSLFFENMYSPYEYLSKIGDYLIICWKPFSVTTTNDERCWRLSIGLMELADLNLLMNKSEKSIINDIIQNYEAFYKAVLDLPDCPFGLSEEEFTLPIDGQLILPESWYKYDSTCSFIKDDKPVKVFKLKAEDFDRFAESQNFSKTKIRKLTNWRN